MGSLVVEVFYEKITDARFKYASAKRLLMV